MAICIYPPYAQDFANNGLGILTPLECTITEEAAGKYELELVHPIDDTLRWAQIQCGCIIRAPAPVRESPLYESTEDITDGESVTVTRKIYKANTRHMYLRKEPKTNTQKLTSLPVGAQVVLLEHRDGEKWARVAKIDGGQVGYCPFGGLTYVRDQQEVISSAKVIGRRVVEIRQSREQLFRIYSVDKDTEAATVTAKAMHIFYDLRGNIIDGEYAPDDADAASVAAEIGAKLLNENPYTIHAERISGRITADYGFKTPVEALLDPDEGIVAQTGCICVRDNYDVFLLPDDVRDMGVTIRRGKNLVGVTVSTDDSDVVTRIIPVGKNKDGDPLYIDAKYVDSPRSEDYPFPRAQRIEYDVSVGKPTEDNKDKVFKTEAEAKAELVRLANQDFDGGCDLPTYGMDVDFVLLANTAEYQQYASLQAVHLYDTVTVIDEMIGIKARVRATGYTWDALAEQYESVKLGELQDVQQTVYSYNLPDKGISGNKIANNSMPGTAMRNASIEYAKISVAAIDQLSAQAITALTARIQEIVANKLTTDELFAAYAEMIALKAGTINADNIQTDALAAELARITVLACGSASFDKATIQHLVAQAMNLEYGVAGQVFIKNLAVEYAQMVGAAIGNLCIKASDGNYYQIDVRPDGTVSAERTTVSAGEIAAGQTDGGRVILETNITAANLSAGNLLATYALVNRIDAARLDVDSLFARDAFVDKLRTSRIYGGKSLEMIVGNVDASARIFRQEDMPGAKDGVKNGDLWILPSAGQTWQATAAEELNLKLAVDEYGYLAYEINGDSEKHRLYMEDGELRAEGFAFPVDEYGNIDEAYTWALVRDGETVRAIENLIDAVDGKTTTYYQSGAPASPATADIWYDTANGKIKRWSGSAWEDITGNALKAALDAAGDAQATADGKIRTFAQTSAPTGMTAKDAGDLWIDTDDQNKLYRWSGTAWAEVRDALITDAWDAVGAANGRIDDLDDSMGAQMARIEADYLSRPDFERIVKEKPEGLYIGDNLSPEQLLLGSGYINFLVDGVLYSRMGKRQVQFGNYILGLAPDDGLAFRPAGG